MTLIQKFKRLQWYEKIAVILLSPVIGPILFLYWLCSLVAEFISD